MAATAHPKTVLFVDEERILSGMLEQLRQKNYNIQVIDPTECFRKPVPRQKLHAVVYEPYFAFHPHGKHFRRNLDSILHRAMRDNALRIAFSSHDENSLKINNFIQHEQYDLHLTKPELPDKIVQYIEEGHIHRTYGDL